MSDLDQHAPEQGADAVIPPDFDLYPAGETKRQAIAAEDITRGDLLYRNGLPPGQVKRLGPDQYTAGGIAYGVALNDAPRFAVVEIETAPDRKVSPGPGISAVTFELAQPPAPAHTPDPSGFPVDLKDDTALASYLGISADDYLTLADYVDGADMTGTAEAVDFWRIVAAVVRGKTLPIGNLLAVLEALTGGPITNG